jgi:eukaryotic-like serine/threonine-protein kinase
MAPEQIVGAPITAATDIFSVGAVLYELLTGVKPFHADTLQSVMYKIVSQPSPELPVNSGVPPAMNEIVAKALAKDPTNRYASATEMANALTAFRAGLGRDAVTSRSISLRSVIDTALADERAAKRTKPSSNHKILIGGGAAAAAVVILASVALVHRGGSSGPSGGAQASVGAQATAPPSTQPAAPAKAAPAPVVIASPTPPPVSPRAVAEPSASTSKGIKTKPANAAVAAATTQELALFRTLRATALENRRRAADAGATADQLREGDDHLKAADGFVAASKVSEAADHLTAATTTWGNAERDAREAAAAAAAATAARAKTTAPDVPKPSSAPVPAPSPPVTVVQPPVAAPAPTVNAAADIRIAVAAYARALESRDIAQVRRAYPDITADQASGFEQFFGTLRSLRATFSAGAIDVSGATAESKLTGEYDYVTNAGKAERQSVAFQATFRRYGGVWRLANVR